MHLDMEILDGSLEKNSITGSVLILAGGMVYIIITTLPDNLFCLLERVRVVGEIKFTFWPDIYAENIAPPLSFGLKSFRSLVVIELADTIDLFGE